jgi:hypothetical protein
MGTRESLEFTEAEHQLVQVDADMTPDPAEVIPVDQDVSHTLVPEIAVHAIEISFVPDQPGKPG